MKNNRRLEYFSSLLFLDQMITKVPLRFLSIEGDGYHLQARIKINGKSALVIVDTGASRTVFDKSEIERYLKNEKIAEHDKLSTGLGTNSMESHFVVINKLELGKIRMEDFDAVILDLKHVNQTYSSIGIKPVAGVLGSDVLVAFNAVIDFKKRSLTLYVPQKKKGAKHKPVKSKRKKS